MDDPCFDLVLRDPEGGILERWPLDAYGWPCNGLGHPVGPKDLYQAIMDMARADMAARQESA